MVIMPEYQLIQWSACLCLFVSVYNSSGEQWMELAEIYTKRCILIIYVFTLMQQRTVYHHSITLLCTMKI